MDINGIRQFLIKSKKRLYKNKVTGSFDNFKGEEILYFKNDEIYRTNYQGGIIDR